MHKYRKDFASVLSASNSNMTKSRFLRLFILSLILIVIMLPTQLLVLFKNVTLPMSNPYSWSDVHGDEWNSVVLIPTGGSVRFDRWPQLAVGFLLFPFFGLGQDAQKMYRNGLLKIGVGRFFPCLHRERSSPQQDSLATGDTETRSSKARLIFQKKISQASFLSL